MTAVLSALDQAESVAVAATLAGLSITAASFLTNIAKTRTEDTAAAKAKHEEALKDVEKAKKPDDKEMLVGAAKFMEARYAEAQHLSDSSSRAMSRLLFGFFCFVAYLVESLSLDPIVEPGLLQATRASLLTYPNLLILDVALSALFFGGGVWAICMSARDMLKLVPKIEKSEKSGTAG
jgi:hypothetical protein